MKKTIFLTTTISLSMVSLSEQALARQTEKNILFILADDLGWNDLGFMGSQYYQTPNLDRLAASGIVFTEAYSACQVSSPSRASIMTGQYTPVHGITNWIGELSGEEWRKNNRHSKLLPAQYVREIDTDDTLLPEYLKECGYNTFMAGKWHLGDQEKDWPEHHGFDINKGGWASGGPKGGYFAPYINPRLEPGEDGENLSMRLANETVNFISNNSRKPFFAYLAFYAVHGAIETTQENWQHFRDRADSMGIAESGFKVDRTLPVRQEQDNPVYAGLIKQMDDAIGVVLDYLEESGLIDQTLIIFTSDNGGVSSGDNYSTSLLPLRGGKGRQFEGGIRVPLIIKSPEASAEISSCSTPVNGIDFYPTIAAFVGEPTPQNKIINGVNISPLLQGDNIAPRDLFWHYPHYGNQGGEPSSIIRRGDWKLIYYYEDFRYELYNLAIDISESETLNAQYPDKVIELKAALHEWLDSTQAVAPEADTEYNPQAEAKVKEQWRTKTLNQREQERLKMLNKDFSPNADWWGSMVTID